MTIRDIAVAALRSTPVVRASRFLTRKPLRILAYHGVSDAESFGEHMRHLAAHYKPVDETMVRDAATNQGELPDRAVWVTFDDGDPSVVANALPALDELGIPATMFVCPGLIESGEPFWWRVVHNAARHAPDATAHSASRAGLGDIGVAADPKQVVEMVKTLADAQRRALVESLEAHTEVPDQGPWRQLEPIELESWLDAGMKLGNHSWDHPCLDMCDPESQRTQVRDAHRWLTDFTGCSPVSFAYPNGNQSMIVEEDLVALGYGVAVLYDNRLTSFTDGPMRLSRLMVEAHEPVDRIASVTSGAQPAAASVMSRFTS